MNYIDRPLRPYWQAVRDTMPGVTGARHTYTDWLGDYGNIACPVSLVIDWHSDGPAGGARCGSDTVEFRVFRNGRSVVPSRVFSHCDHLDAFFQDYGSGPVAHFCPPSVVEALRSECLKYLDRGGQ